MQQTGRLFFYGFKPVVTKLVRDVTQIKVVIMS